MKKNLPPFIAGMLTTALIGGLSITALAASGTVVFNSVNIRLNGQQVSAKGENFTIGNGQSVPGSILYEDATGGGTTYVPLARLAELLGTKIGWDGSTGSVLIGEEPNAPDPVTTADYSDWTAEQEAAYQEFKGMWKITLDKRTTSNELLYTAKYSNELKMQDFKIAWSEIPSDRKDTFAQRLAREYQSENKNMIVGIAFYYNSTNLGYANAYERGNTLSSFLPNPFLDY